MVSYNASIDPIVDFRSGFTSDWDALWQDFYCDWRNMHFNQGIEPPSWVIGGQVLAAGAKGILFNSAITGDANLVIYTDALTGADAINVDDPNNDLPKNQLSWQ
ncbi:RES domain-containing protein [Actimicrobium antarcticum]